MEVTICLPELSSLFLKLQKKKRLQTQLSRAAAGVFVTRGKTFWHRISPGVTRKLWFVGYVSLVGHRRESGFVKNGGKELDE